MCVPRCCTLRAARRAAHLRGAVLPEVCLGKDSLRVQVRLRTSVPAAESGSAQK